MFGRSTSGFGGFSGASGNTTSPFGAAAPANTSPFGQNTAANNTGFGNSSGGVFGNNAAATTGSAFGANTGSTFGNNGSSFGAGSSAFGNTNNNSMFGANNAQNNTTLSPFGAAAAPASNFGTSAAPNLFGAASKPFGSSFGTPQNNSISPFGGAQASNTAFGGADANTNNGTATKPFTPFSEKDTLGTSYFQNISSMPEYKNFSFEELRLKDYEQNRRYGTGNTGASSFGAPASTGFSFGGAANNTAATGSAFGAPATGSAFGATPSAFGQAPASGFGLTSAFGANNATSGVFGQTGNTTSPFGASAAAPATSAFGAPATGTSAFGSGTSAFGALKPAGFGSAFGASNTNSAFGATNNQSTFGGSAFGGNNTASAPFGALTTNTGFGANNATSSPFGAANNTSNTGGLFGAANNNTSSAFGANNNNTSAFGAPATNNASGGLFGGSSTFGKPAAQGGLFGANNNTQLSGLGTNTNGLFGQSNTNNTNTGGLFGASTQNNNAGGGLFGAAQNNNASGGLFGATQNNTANTSGGLFGAKPAGTTGGLFGGSTGSNPTAFGATQNNTGGLFGSKPAATTGGGLFGLNNSTQAQSGGLFGLNNTAGTTGGLFGGSNTNSNTAGGNNSSLLGKPATTFGLGGLFGGNTNNTATSANGNTGGLFGGGIGQQQQQQQQQQNGQQLLVNISGQNPYGNNSLFQGISTQNNSQSNNAPLAVAVNPPVKKKLTLGSAHRVAPLFEQLRKVTPVNSVRATFTGEAKKTESIFSSDVDKAIMASDIFAPKTDFRKLVVNGSKSSTGLLAYTEEANKPLQVSFTVDKIETSVPLVEYDASPVEEADDDGYWTSPPLSELKKKSLSQLRSIENFTVGRKFYGVVKFTKPVDLSAFNLDDICGNVVVFGSKNVILYPEDDKPQVGEGLNMPAEVTLEGCYPVNKKTKLAILDPKDEVVKKHIAKLKLLPDMTFKAYEPTSGNWTFSFDHV